MSRQVLRGVRVDGLLPVPLLTPLTLLMLLLLAAPAARAQGLFRDSSVLDVRIVADLRAALDDRDSTKFRPHVARLTYRVPGGVARTFPVTLRARGHFRRQARNCSFPPVRLEFERRDARETLFQGNSQLKITTSCRPRTPEFEQYVLSEYALYRAYQAVSPKYFRTRLARITYSDTTRAIPDAQSWAFFIEDDKEVAKKFDLTLIGTRGALFADLHEPQLAITALFQYMVANTDWSISGLHNVSLMRDSIGVIHPVAFDFDWSGAVNARYAFPDARLGIRAVTQRLYRGPCLTAEEWQPIFARFVAARPHIAATVESLTALEPRRKRAMLEYLAEFYATIADPKSARGALGSSCLPQGN